MGATNSAPTTVKIENPYPIEITAEAIERLSNVHKQQQQQQHQQQQQQGEQQGEQQQQQHPPAQQQQYQHYEHFGEGKAEQPNIPHIKDTAGSSGNQSYCETCRKRIERQKAYANYDLISRRYAEVEEEEFDRTQQKLQSLLGKPINWKTECEEELKKLRERVIQCNKENFKNPLACTKISQEFQKFVATKQLNTIFREKGIEQVD